MQVSQRGQITIPKRLRDALGIGAGTAVSVEQDGDAVVIRKLAEPSRGRRLAASLRGRGDVAMTTDEILALTRGE